MKVVTSETIRVLDSTGGGAPAYFASPNAAAAIPGRFYDQSMAGSGSGLTAGVVNNRIYLYPFFTAMPMRIDQMGIIVTASANNAKMVIYESGPDMWPENLLYESNLFFTAVGYAHTTLDFTFEGNKGYWVGVKTSGSATFRAYSRTNAYTFGGRATGTDLNDSTVILGSPLFADPAPDPWILDPLNLFSQDPISIKMRAAALP